MRFVLDEISANGLKAKLSTNNTNKTFWTDTKDLIFIETRHNREKADKLEKKRSKIKIG